MERTVAYPSGRMLMDFICQRTISDFKDAVTFSDQSSVNQVKVLGQRSRYSDLSHQTKPNTPGYREEQPEFCGLCPEFDPTRKIVGCQVILDGALRLDSNFSGNLSFLKDSQEL